MELMGSWLAYILTSRRTDGIRLDKAYGNNEAWFLYMDYAEARHRLDGMPEEDKKFWVIVPVWVRSDSCAWEATRTEREDFLAKAE